ncbi:hypothetical protein M1293_01720 [Candidatus Parvarchaeota archaeon]|nr:hypothetical protein [Candidatus Parvarchaeota archaeon]
MDSGVISDVSIDEIDKSHDRVRFVGKAKNIDAQIGTLDVFSENKILTCILVVNQDIKINDGDNLLVTGRVAKTDEEEIEIRVDAVQKISESQAVVFNKYLNLRRKY